MPGLGVADRSSLRSLSVLMAGGRASVRAPPHRFDSPAPEPGALGLARNRSGGIQLFLSLTGGGWSDVKENARVPRRGRVAQ
jgi:hypothetical protein